MIDREAAFSASLPKSEDPSICGIDKICSYKLIIYQIHNNGLPSVDFE